MHSLTIKSLIHNHEIEGISLKAGFKGIENKVFNTGIIENPDYFDWFSAGDFILTTGYIFLDNVELQRKLVKELADQNCAGLGIKVRKYWDEIPIEIINTANALGLPVVEIPYTYSLSQVSKIVNSIVNKREESVLKKYQEIHNSFSKCSIEGGDLWEIVKLTSDLVENPIIMLDSSFNLLSYYEREDNPFQLADHLQLIERERVFNKSFTDGIPTNTQKFTLSIKRKYKANNNEIVCRVFPIAYSQKIYGYIIVWEVLRKLEYIHYVALENAAQTAALERIKTKQMVEAQHKMKQGFFDDLLQGKIISVNAVKSLAEIHGMNPDKNHICAVIKTDDAKKSILTEIENICLDQAMKIKRRIRPIIRGNNVILFIELMESEGVYEPSKEVHNFLQMVKENIDLLFQKVNFKIGVSNVCYDFLKIGEACLLAQEVLRLSKKFDTDSKILFFNDLSSYHLIDSTMDKNKCAVFFEQTLGQLRDYDIAKQTDLMETLDYYYQANGNVSDAAKKMFVHRNTLIYRIEKIKQVLGHDLKDAEYNFNCQLALHISKIIDIKQ